MKAVESYEDHEIREMLRKAADEAGSGAALAALLCVDRSYMNKMIKGDLEINHVVAAHIGVKKCSVYVPMGTKPDTKQEQYEKQREEWSKQVEALGYKTGAEGARRTGQFIRATPPDPMPDLLKAQRERRIERLAQREAEDKA